MFYVIIVHKGQNAVKAGKASGCGTAIRFLTAEVNNMGFMDKLLESASKAEDSLQKSVNDYSKKMKNYEANKREMAKPLEGAIKRYSVTYDGGLEEYPQKIVAAIGMNIMPDRFVFTPTVTSKDWFKGYEIPYTNIYEINIVKRTLSTAEVLLGAAKNASQQQENVICFLFTDDNGTDLTLRMEMLTGTTIYHQAEEAQNFMALLRKYKITDQFRNNKTEKNDSSSGGDVLAQIEKLHQLKEAGILTEDEFKEKKKVLLDRL